MSTASGSAFLLWAILSSLFSVFLVYHLWSYDRFKCLQWSSGRQPGAFKRVMTYSYLGSVPLFTFFSIAITVIKFKEGFIVTPDNQVIPRPYQLYSPAAKAWIIPLDFVFSIAYAFELVTHLEELAFWMYLLHQDAQKAEWFSSWEYRFWYLSSCIAVLGMPMTAVVTRKNIQTCDAYIFLVGASGSTLTTICFLYVLWRFPAFILHVKSEGADPAVVVRLATFYQLNLARVVFRFLFTIPLIIVAVDGIFDDHHVINRNLFWTDFLHMISGIGCFVSTTITLLIFFPRSIIKESGYKPKPPTIAASSPKSIHSISPNLSNYHHQPPDGSSPYPGQFGNPSSPLYVGEFRPEDVNVHYPYPHNVTGLPPDGRATSEETDDWDDEDESTEADERQGADGGRHHYEGAEEVPPYPSSPRLPPSLHSHGQAAMSHSAMTRFHAHRTQSPSIQSTQQQVVSPPDGSADQEVPLTEVIVQPSHPPQPQYQDRISPGQHQQAGIYHRLPFPHSPSNSHILTPTTPASPFPQPIGPVTIIDMTSARRQTNSRRYHTRRASSGVVLQSPAQVLQGNRNAGLGVTMDIPEDEHSSVTLRDMPQSPPNGADPGSASQGQSGLAKLGPNLHPYVMTFTSPIDLVDIPANDGFPRT